MAKGLLCAMALSCLVALAGVSQAGVPSLINYQGKLTGPDGNPLNGTVRLGFGFYDAPAPPPQQQPEDPVYYEEQTVEVHGGIFNVLIGNGSEQRGLFERIPWHDPLYLQTSIFEEGGNIPVPLLPRHRIASVVYALRAGTVDDTQQDLAARVAALEELLAHFTRSGDNVYITGANVHVRNGMDGTETTNGRGNLIVGYNEGRPYPIITPRTGSHNIVVGTQHSFTSYGGLVAGHQHNVIGTYASVLGGSGNIASGDFSSVTGGSENTASGGYLNEAGGRYASVSGGNQNVASYW